MKKNGFTLAEMLITLSIIGVVAALAAPALNASIQKAKVGPSLRKFVTTMENGNEHILQEEEINKLSELTSNTIGPWYTGALTKYVKGERKTAKEKLNIYKHSGNEVYNEFSENSENGFEFADGSAMWLEDNNKVSKNPQGAYKRAIATIYYDINGFGIKPDKLGKDIFIFYLDDSGTLIPKGGKLEYSAYNDQTKEQAWKDSDDECTETTVGDGANCTGAIADNNWKATYKY